jgi:hypothetical protein
MHIPMPFFDYVALYLPAVSSSKADPSRRGFWTKRGAWKFIEQCELIDGICRVCGRTGCDVYLSEWEVLRYSAYKKCNSFIDILEAAGHEIEKSWPKDEVEGENDEVV